MSRSHGYGSAWALLVVAAAAYWSPVAVSGAEGALEEVVVTATKRRQWLQDVPISVQALGEQVLAQQGISDVATLAASVPGLSLADGGPAYRTLYIRGVSSEYGSAGTTGVYMDDTFIPAGGIVQTIIEPLYFDLDRIEVLRGPQGTLFGGSSMGGTVRFITRQPQYERFAASAGTQASYTRDGGFNYELDGLLNVPLASERAAVRIVTAYRDNEGFIDKLVGDFSDPQRLGGGAVRKIDNVNDERFAAARVQFALRATDRLEVRPMFLYQRTKVASFGAFDRPPGRYDQRRGIAVEEPVNDELRLGSVSLTYDWGELQLLSSTSYSERRAAFEEDASDSTEETVLPRFFGLPRGLFFDTTYDGRRIEESLQEELRLSSSPAESLQWVAGLYYEDYDQANAFNWLIPGFSEAAFAVPDDNFYRSKSTLDRTQKAVFAELTWPLSQRLKATVGLRGYRFEARTQSFDRDGLLNGGSRPDGPVLRSKESGVTPRLSVSYDVGEQLLYATAAKGFRPGGPNAPVPGVASGSSCVAEYRAAGIEVSNDGEVESYESDQLWNYEVGAKTTWAANRAVMNIAAYRMNWDDLQSLFLPACFFAATVNFGKARISGVEIDYRIALTGAFEVAGGLNYNDARMAQDLPALGVAHGTPLQNAPMWGGNLNLRYAIPLAFGQGYAVGTARYVDDSFRSFNRSDPRTFQGSYTLLGARLGIDAGSWDASLFVDNLTNADPAVFHFISAFFGTASHTRMFPIRPRTVGVSVRVDF